MKDYERITLANHNRYKARRAQEEAARAADRHYRKIIATVYACLGIVMVLLSVSLFITGENLGGFLMLLATTLSVAMVVEGD